jgi:hypothetical protein
MFQPVGIGAIVFMLLSATMASSAAFAGVSFRCDGGLVSTGDHKIDLLGKCGPPDRRDAYQRERSVFARDRGQHIAADRRVSVAVEKWTYDFGPHSFVQFVTLEAGRIIAIEAGEHGYAQHRASHDEDAAIRRAACEPSLFAVNMSALEVLDRCGGPAVRDQRVETRSISQPVGDDVVASESVDVTVEVWTYDFGPKALIRLLEIEDGRVSRIALGGYGYSR